MSSPVTELLAPRILIVDDERQIHASLRLRLGKDYSLVCHTDPRQALAVVAEERFDLCIVDIHMPHMHGLTFVEMARKSDPELGYIILSAFDSDENLRRTIPLQVYDFVSKPLPGRADFEGRIPQWIEQTRYRRRRHELAQNAGAIASDRDSARLERDVELVASETARDALLQTASLLTTIHAHLVSATSLVAARVKNDPGATHLLRNLEEARKTADAAVSVADNFFGSAYGNRDSSPALVNEGVRHAISIAMRMAGAEQANKAVDFTPVDERLPIHGLSGIEFLLTLAPALAAAVAVAEPDTTIGIRGEHLQRLEAVTKDPRCRACLWINRKNAVTSRAGISLAITARGPAFTRPQFEAWLKSEYAPLAAVAARGLVGGIRKSHGLLGSAISPDADLFALVLALPT